MHRALGGPAWMEREESDKQAGIESAGIDDQLMPLVYARAREIAGRELQGDRAHRWVRASSLVNMAFVRLLELGGSSDPKGSTDEARLLAVLTTIMRRTVVDIARAATADKRGGGAVQVSLHTQGFGDAKSSISVVEIDDAMRALGEVCEESARVAELRLWGGMEFEQIAEAMSIPFSRVRSRWNRAKAFLAKDLSDTPSETDQ